MIGVLIPGGPGEPPPPASLPIARAALRLGTPVVFGDQAHGGVLRGHQPVDENRWVPVEGRVSAVYDRFPSQSQPETYTALLAGLPGVVVENPPALTALLRDKLATQQALMGHVPMPEVVADPAEMRSALDRWGVAFHKPRFGSFGRGVRCVHPGDPLPAVTDGGVRGTVEPALLQRGVAPPPGLAGVSVRVLVQRVGGQWTARTPVARLSSDDPVVNAARGAGIEPVEDRFGGGVAARVAQVAQQTAAVLCPGNRGVEMGVDLVLDAGLSPWVIEVNARPRGRLHALAAQDGPRYQDAHDDAVLAPLVALVEG